MPKKIIIATMFKIFKKKDRMISAVSKLVDTLTFRNQKNEMRYIKIITFFICLMFSIQSISSQSIEAIRNADIDSYSDSQIASYWNKAQQQGYSLEQLELIAKSKGMSSAKFMKLKNRILNSQQQKSVILVKVMALNLVILRTDVQFVVGMVK